MPVLQATKHDLDAVAPLVPALVVSHGLAAGLPSRDARLDTLVFQGFAEPVGIVTPISDQPVDWRQRPAQCPRSDIVAHLAGGDEKADRTTDAVGDCVQLRPSRRLCQSPAGQWYMPPLDRPIRRPRPPFSRPCWSRCGVPSGRSRRSSRSFLLRVWQPGRPSSGRKCLSRSNASTGCTTFSDCGVVKRVSVLSVRGHGSLRGRRLCAS